jgi:hypothetical protein
VWFTQKLERIHYIWTRRATTNFMEFQNTDKKFWKKLSKTQKIVYGYKIWDFKYFLQKEKNWFLFNQTFNSNKNWHKEYPNIGLSCP